ncbi:MAG: VapE family protein, partial [Candidatus Pacebacteria bacterium]|nr:VapE family protein [Candidatus Paceibacterota bacterium]
MNTDAIDSAIRLAGMGFGVIPVNPTNKVSIIRWKIDGPLRDAATITEFWNKNPNAKVAVTPPPGYEFVDLDRKNGKDGLAALAAKGYEWPEGGWRYYTESGGEHALFKLPDGIKGPTDASVVADGVDRRGAGTGYVVCHALYGCAWISQQAPLPAPAWVYAGCGPIGRAVELHDIKRPVGMTDIQLQDLCTRAVAHAARFNDRDAWRDLGFALHHESGGSEYGLTLFDWLSQQPAARAPNEPGGRDKYSARACEQLWRSASDDDRPGGTVTIRSLIDIVGASDIARQVASQDRIEEKHGEVVRDVPVETPVLSSAYTPSDLAHKWGAEGMLMNKSLKWPAQLDYVIHALGTAGWGHRYGYDTFRNEIMYCDWSGPNEGQWRPFIDVMYTQCMLDLIHVGFDPALKYDMVRRAVQFVADRFKFDSAQVWLDSLEWDGIPRIAKFMTAYCGATDDAYSDAVSRYMWSGAAGRIIDPGHKCDMIPVFVTPNVQGVKKSHGIEALSPDRDHYVTIDLSVRDAELSRKLRGKLFVELA